MAASDHAAARRPGIPGKALAILYLTAAAAPLLAAWATGVEPESHWSEFGAGLAMISGAMFFLQFWSSGRFETLSGRVGIDRASIVSPPSWPCWSRLRILSCRWFLDSSSSRKTPWFCSERCWFGPVCKETYCLVCGPAAMMEIAIDALLDIGVPAGHILYERFDYAAGHSALDKRRRNQALAILAAVLAIGAAFAWR